MPPLITKFWRVKAFTIVASFFGTGVVWAALAWPAWTAPASPSTDETAAALQYIAAMQESGPAAAAPDAEGIAGEPAAKQVVVVRRQTPREQIVVITEPGAPLPEIPVPVAPPPAAAAPGTPPEAAPAPRQVQAPPRRDPAPSAPPPSPAPPAAPTPRPAPPPPAPSKGS